MDVQADAGTTPRNDAAVASDAKVGEFSLQLVAPDEASDTAGFTSLLGKVFDGPSAEATAWTSKASEGGCTLLTPKIPFCDPQCDNGSVCVEDDVCRASPSAIGVGTVTIKGVKTADGASEFTVEPIKNAYQAPSSLPYPAFEEGAAISVEAASFTIEGRGIAPLTLSAESYPLRKNEPLALTWNAASSDSRIQVKLDISHHGGTKGKIECDVADTGSLSISASLVGALLDLGVAGFPTIVVTRSSVGSTTTSNGRVDLRSYMYVERAIEIEGLTSCSGSEDCPSGQSCQDDLTCG